MSHTQPMIYEMDSKPPEEPRDLLKLEEPMIPVDDRKTWWCIGIINVPWACAIVWCIWQVLK
jgi:hypothetical protein